MKKGNRFVGKAGQAMVEFAIVLPFLVLLIFGMIEFGRVLNAQIIVTQAAREGARAGAIIVYDPDTDTAGVIETRVTTAARTAANRFATQLSNDMQVTPEFTYSSATTNMPVKVTVSHPVQLATPVINQFFTDSTITVRGVAEMRFETRRD